MMPFRCVPFFRVVLVLAWLLTVVCSFTASPRPFHQTRRCDTARLRATTKDSFNVKVNEFFKRPLPAEIQAAVGISQKDSTKTDFGILDLVTASPSLPGTPRPLWLVILASIPTGLIWYGYYKFAIEEELLELELTQGKKPRGYGGFGTLGPFTYGLILGPLAAILHLPGGLNWTGIAIAYIYYTQFLLYDRVNELYKEEGRFEPPLTVWWCWPWFFPLNLVVGLRQVHFLSQYWYRQRGMETPPNDPVVDFFPFIKEPTLAWQDFFTTPSLWCSLLSNQKDIDRSKLPGPIQELMAMGQKDGKGNVK